MITLTCWRPLYSHFLSLAHMSLQLRESMKMHVWKHCMMGWSAPHTLTCPQSEVENVSLPVAVMNSGENVFPQDTRMTQWHVTQLHHAPLCSKISNIQKVTNERENLKKKCSCFPSSMICDMTCPRLSVSYAHLREKQCHHMPNDALTVSTSINKWPWSMMAWHFMLTYSWTYRNWLMKKYRKY